MPKRIPIAFVLLALAATFALAQVPVRQKVLPREKPRLRTAVTVLDLRNVMIEKKPPKREMEPTSLPRMMSGARTEAARAALSPGQLNDVLRDIGLGAAPPNVYARFTPSQMSVPGKGFMSLSVPEWVYPDHAEFLSHEKGDLTWTYNGPAIVLREPGTYVLDFLVEFTGYPIGTSYGCDAMIGFVPRQTQTVASTGSPQHILVVTSLDPALLALGDEMKAVGLHCYKAPTPELLVLWTFYLVDVTKL